MIATILNDYEVVPTLPTGPIEDVIEGGHFETVQDDDTGGIKRVWVEDQAVATPRPGTVPEGQPTMARFDIPCYVRGFTDLGFRSTANTETFLNGVYRAVEVVQMTFPANYSLNRRQFVTNVRGRNKNILWLEEDTGQPTVFEVQGVTPSFDPFGRHIDNTAVLNRANIQ
jgi:hypothetical protein